MPQAEDKGYEDLLQEFSQKGLPQQDFRKILSLVPTYNDDTIQRVLYVGRDEPIQGYSTTSTEVNGIMKDGRMFVISLPWLDVRLFIFQDCPQYKWVQEFVEEYRRKRENIIFKDSPGLVNERTQRSLNSFGLNTVLTYAPHFVSYESILMGQQRAHAQGYQQGYRDLQQSFHELLHLTPTAPGYNVEARY